jgi:hypothetical protein
LVLLRSRSIAPAVSDPRSLAARDMSGGGRARGCRLARRQRPAGGKTAAPLVTDRVEQQGSTSAEDIRVVALFSALTLVVLIDTF